MTLTVAQIHNGGITFVSDTKVTHYGGDDTFNRQVFRNSLPKIVILRDDVAVGLAGDNPHLALQRICRHRNSPVETLVADLESATYASFIVATLDPPRLISIKNVNNGGPDNREVDDRAPYRRAFVGDIDAYSRFQESFYLFNWGDTEEDEAVELAMFDLIAREPVESVGGFPSRVRYRRFSDTEGFRFASDSFRIGAWHIESRDSNREPWLDIYQRLSNSESEVPYGYEIVALAGKPPTIGASAYFMPDAQFGMLFPEASPWAPVILRTNSGQNLVDLALTEYGQSLEGGSWNRAHRRRRNLWMHDNPNR